MNCPWPGGRGPLAFPPGLWLLPAWVRALRPGQAQGHVPRPFVGRSSHACPWMSCPSRGPAGSWPVPFPSGTGAGCHGGRGGVLCAVTTSPCLAFFAGLRWFSGASLRRRDGGSACSLCGRCPGPTRGAGRGAGRGGGSVRGGGSGLGLGGRAWLGPAAPSCRQGSARGVSSPSLSDLHVPASLSWGRGGCPGTRQPRAFSRERGSHWGCRPKEPGAVARWGAKFRPPRSASLLEREPMGARTPHLPSP